MLGMMDAKEEGNEMLFDVKLCKGSPPQSLGFNFKKPQEDSRIKGFLIVAVIPGGILGQYNATQAAGGTWDKVVLPGMRIRGVNGVENNFASMLQELKEKETVILRVQSKRKNIKAPSLLSPDVQRLLRERVAALMVQNKERLRQAMGSDEEYKAVSAELGEDVVKHLSDMLTPDPLYSNKSQPSLVSNSSSQLRPASSPAYSAHALTFSNLSVSGNLGSLGPPDEEDEEVMSEESV